MLPVIIAIIIILIAIIIGLLLMVYMQIKMAGMNIKDFYSFIKANQRLEKLYKFANLYEKLPTNEQLIFLKEAEVVFSAFEKVPSELWEEEYDQYMKVLQEYQEIKMDNWKNK